MKIKKAIGPRARHFARDIWQLVRDIVSWKLTWWEWILVIIAIMGVTPSEVIAGFFAKLDISLINTVISLSIYSAVVFFCRLYYIESLINKTSLNSKMWVKIFRNGDYLKEHKFVKFIIRFGCPGLFITSAMIPFGGTLLCSAAYGITHIRFGRTAIILGDVAKICCWYYLGGSLIDLVVLIFSFF